jgi:centromere protein X
VTKIQQETLKLAAEYLRLFLIEALNRAKLEAIVDDSPTVEPHHVEQIVAQLLLDF